MWKRAVGLLAAFGLLAILGTAAVVGYIAVTTVKPDLVNADLRKEFAVAGLSIGESDLNAVLQALGQPEMEYREPLSIRYEYPARGLTVRIGVESGKLEWYEFSSPNFATARGIRVGASFTDIQDAYGKPSAVTPLMSGTRVRYQYGIAYTLEFWLDKTNRVTRIGFFKD